MTRIIGGMTADIDRAAAFLAGNARVLERRRFDMLFADGSASDALAALDAYRNADGGYGWGLEPDLRTPNSQPVAALHAFEIFEEVGTETEQARRLCDWLGSVTLADGGLPFALPATIPDGSAPFWVEVDPKASTLHMTCMLAGIAYRVGQHDRGVGDHPWLQIATEYSIREIRALDGSRGAHEFSFALQFLDAVHDAYPDAAAELRRLGKLVPASGTIPVSGGQPDEALRLLDLSPRPNRPLRELFDADVVAEALDRLAAGQQDDGGWTVDFLSTSAAGALEWRGYATVDALAVLQAHGRL
jgi:hypothetical protein